MTHAHGWLGEWNDADICHVHPVSDLRPHTLDDACWCGPTEDEGLMVHHSMDRREEFETGRKAS